MLKDLKLKAGEQYRLWASNCPVIKAMTVVKILHVWKFPATNTVFVTIEDLENKTINHKGQEEKIISTIPYTYPTAFQPVDYLH